MEKKLVSNIIRVSLIKEYIYQLQTKKIFKDLKTNYFRILKIMLSKNIMKFIFE